MAAWPTSQPHRSRQMLRLFTSLPHSVQYTGDPHAAGLASDQTGVQ
jgi:hypothetical protein